MSQTVVGKLNKAFGVKGYIKVVPQKPFISDLKKSDVWFIQRGNDAIPYFVESIQEDPHFLIKFEDIDSPESAKDITGCTILLKNKDISIEKAKEGDGEHDLNKLVGFEVRNGENSIGEIINIEEYPQQLMAFIQNIEGELMMPLTPEYILDINLESRLLIVDLPDGFVESQI